MIEDITIATTDMFGLLDSFTPLEVLLITSLGTLAGAIAIMGRFFYKYLDKTNKERSNEIRSSVQVQTELLAVMRQNTALLEKLPEVMHDKVRVALLSKR